MKRARLVMLSFALVLVPTTAFALKARDVMEAMTEQQRFGYVAGLIDMLAYYHALGQDTAKRDCIYKLFYKTKDGPRLVYRALKKWPDKASEGVVVVLINQVCGKSKLR